MVHFLVVCIIDVVTLGCKMKFKNEQVLLKSPVRGTSFFLFKFIAFFWVLKLHQLLLVGHKTPKLCCNLSWRQNKWIDHNRHKRCYRHIQITWGFFYVKVFWFIWFYRLTADIIGWELKDLVSHSNLRTCKTNDLTKLDVRTRQMKT